MPKREVYPLAASPCMLKVSLHALPPRHTANQARRQGRQRLQSYVEAEKLGQIAFVLPSAVVLCGAAGYQADRLLHQKWMLVAGIVFGSISGLYYVIQTAYAAEKASRKQDAAQNGTGKGSRTTTRHDPRNSSHC